MTDLHPRYPGSPPFADTDIDRLLFYGRGDEATRVTDSILSYDLLVVYGVSGTGKSSLLQAGVFHRLRAQDAWPVVVRLNDPGADPVASIAERLARAGAAEGLELLPAEPGGDDLWDMLANLEVWRGDVLQTPVLVFDQFEELFTLDWDAEVRDRFVEQFGWVTRGHRPIAPGEQPSAPPRVKVVILIREDSLGELEALTGDVPHILRNRFRLLPLRLDQAEAAIRGPARVEDPRLVSPPFEYAGDAIELMLGFLRVRHERGREVQTDSVEPSQLQIICQHVEDVVVGGRSGGDVVVTATDLGGTAGLNSILQQFYGGRIAALPPDEAARVRELCETGLINQAGRRLSLEVGEIEAAFGVGPAQLNRLVQQRLLRAEGRTGSVYYELAHDSLVAPILAHRQAEEERAAAEAEQRRQARARWVYAGVAVLGLTLAAAGMVWALQRSGTAGERTAQGRVTTGDERPLADVVVEFHVDDPAVGESSEDVSVTTDADGRFEALLAAGQEYRVRFVKTGFVEQWWEQAAAFADAKPIEVGQPGGMGDLDAALEPGASISFTASAGGEPVAVELTGTTVAGDAVQRAVEVAGEGAFEALEEGSYTIRFSRDGFAPDQRIVGLGAGEDHDVGLVTLARPTQVALDALGPPEALAGTRYELSYTIANQGEEAVTLLDVSALTTVVDLGGIELGPGANRRGTIGLSAPDEARCETIPVTLRWEIGGEQDETIDPAAVCTEREVTGAVLLAGEPVAGARVTATGTDGDAERLGTMVTETDADGTYAFRLFDGVYGILVTGVPRAAEVAQEATIEVGPGTPGTLPSIDFSAELFTISGTFASSVDRGGNPLEVVPEAVVSLCTQPPERDQCKETTTDADGKFVLTAPAGSYELQALGGSDGMAYFGFVDVDVVSLDVTDLVLIGQSVGT